MDNICFKKWDHCDDVVQRRIVSAANKYILELGYFKQEIIIPASRHFSPAMNSISRAIKFLIKDRVTYSFKPMGSEGQGFIDQFDDFHDREDALIIATAAGQLIGREKTGNDYELFSEDLY